MFTGLKTILFNAAIAAGLAGLTYLAGVDWTQYVSPTLALILTSVVNIGLRFLTSTPALKSA
jgi:hypothetical protein